MSDERSDGPLDERAVRIRVSVTPSLIRRVERISAAIAVSQPQVLTMCLALGARFIDLSVVKPLDSSIKAAVDARASAEALAAFAEGMSEPNTK